jgi:hypothetical protein
MFVQTTILEGIMRRRFLTGAVTAAAMFVMVAGAQAATTANTLEVITPGAEGPTLGTSSYDIAIPLPGAVCSVVPPTQEAFGSPNPPRSIPLIVNVCWQGIFPPHGS